MARERTRLDEEMGLQKELAPHAPPPALSFPGTGSQPAQQRTILRDKPCGKKTSLFHAFQGSKQSEGLSHLGL